MNLRRYSRQVRLAEIGERGQRKLSAARIETRGPTEERYVVLAGMQAVRDRPTVDPSAVDRSANVATLGLRHAAPRELAEGALRALAAIRAVLEEPT